MTAETITSNDETVATCDHQRQLDHIDEMLHELLQKVSHLDPLLPLLPRALAMLDPGAAMRRTFRKGQWRAIQEPASAPVHVGEASEDRGPVGA